MTAERITAIVVAVVITAVLWRLYFGRDQRQARDVVARSGGRHHLVRDTFSYLHIPIVAGLIVTAVANELVVLHPDEELRGAELVALAVGPILFLLGTASAVFRVLGTVSRRRPIAAAGVAAAAVAGTLLSADSSRMQAVG